MMSTVYAMCEYGTRCVNFFLPPVCTVQRDVHGSKQIRKADDVRYGVNKGLRHHVVVRSRTLTQGTRTRLTVGGENNRKRWRRQKNSSVADYRTDGDIAVVAGVGLVPKLDVRI